MSPPPVSVIMAVLDEEGHIGDVIASLGQQDHDGPLEFVVADGGSDDGTLERLRSWMEQDHRVVLVDNPDRVQSAGLNLAAETASGEILVRADGHTTYPPDYVRRSVRSLLDSEAVAVGGNLTPVGTTPFGSAVAAVMTSPLTIGPGKFHHADEPQEVDTVYLGTFRRSDLLEIGGYRTLPSGVAEDADLYYRWRVAGRSIRLDPAIRSAYRPRQDPSSFLRQSFRYGVGKAEMLWVNGRLPSWRPLAPLALVLGIATTLGVAVTTGWPVPAALLLGSWLGLALVVGVRRGRSVGEGARIVAAIAIMHLAYGAGMLVGLAAGMRIGGDRLADR